MERSPRLRRFVHPLVSGRIGFTGDQVTDFYEKPETGEGWINGGYFVLNRRALDYIEGDESIWEHGPVDRLAKDGQLMGYRHHGFWSCMDTLKKKTPWKNFGIRARRHGLFGSRSLFPDIRRETAIIAKKTR